MIPLRFFLPALWFAIIGIECFSLKDVSAEPLHAYSLPTPSPMRWFTSRVSGQSKNGFKDGDFFEAKFNQPEGIVVDNSGGTLYVADSGNARIRRVLLQQSNRTETLAGTGEIGERDGAFLTAQFENPTRLTFLNPTTLLVVERAAANALPFRLRRLNLADNVVDTVPLQWSSYPGTPAMILDVALGLEPDVVIFVPNESPGAIALNLVTGEFKKITPKDPNLLKRVVSVSSQGRHLLLADQQGEQLVSLDMTNWTFASNPAVETRVVAPVPKITLVRALGSLVYVTQAGVNCISRVNQTGEDRETPLFPVGIFSVAGTRSPCVLEQQSNATRPALYFADSNRPDMIALNPANPYQIFVSQWPWGNIESIRDYDQEKLSSNTSEVKRGMPDFRYPKRKDPGVFRILMVGDSRTFHAGVDPDPTSKVSKFHTLPKQLELQLNLSSSMRGIAQQYEVLNLSDVSWYPVWSWGQYRIPRAVREYDIDLVLFSVLEVPRPYLLLQFPLPDNDLELSQEPSQDGEWALSPDIGKGNQQALKGLYDAVREVSPTSFLSDGKLAMPDIHEMCVNDRLRSALFNCYGNLLTNIGHAVSRAKGSPEKAPILALAYLPEDYEGSTECASAMMKDICQQSGVSLLNLAPFLTAASSSLYMSHGVGGDHLVKFGFLAYADILADALIQSGAVR